MKRKSKWAQPNLPYKPTEETNRMSFGFTCEYLKGMYPNMSEAGLFNLALNEEDDFYDDCDFYGTANCWNSWNGQSCCCSRKRS